MLSLMNSVQLPDWAIFRWIVLICSGLVVAAMFLLASWGSEVTRLTYSLGLFVMAIISWALRNYGGNFVPELFHLCTGTCFEYMAVFRITFGFFIYHALLCIMTFGVTTGTSERGKIQNGLWLAKAIILTIILVCMFYVPSNVFDIFAYISLVCGILFLIVEGVIMLDLSCRLAEFCQEKYDKTSSNEWMAAMILIASLIFLLVTVSSVVCFAYFQGILLVPSVVNLVLVFICVVSSISPCVRESNNRSGLMQAAFISLFTTYISLSAIGSWPAEDIGAEDPDAPPTPGKEELFQALFWLGMIGTFILLGVVAMSTRSGEWSTPETEEDSTSYSYSMFHLIFMLAACFICELLVNWDTITTGSVGEGEEFKINSGTAAFWIKTVSAWLLSILYLSSLYAPIFVDSCSDKQLCVFSF